MSSTIPALFLSSETLLGDLFSDIENGFTPWDGADLYSAIQSPKPVGSSSGSDETNVNRTNSNSGSDDQNLPVSVIDERKRRRMISNRESARRSRMRKQKHLENLRNQVNRLKLENRELTNRLQIVMHHCQRVWTDNDRLQSEHIMLRKKLSEIRRILVFRQLQQYSCQ
ncbi:hypothetical protein ACOSP7_023347 [Xanthoceras sorbifolium]|uniref:BZIP domain-containing protein n=1 Tax=Xanthoceras sorbifolium TaxID=99658 RepID=A0ABQ8HQY9_9ROSI|nr:hypothetical protein JRO89_XS08G0222700 [Xanthoceras sorbifolium]